MFDLFDSICFVYTRIQTEEMLIICVCMFGTIQTKGISQNLVFNDPITHTVQRIKTYFQFII